jgi:hypothetical protein
VRGFLSSARRKLLALRQLAREVPERAEALLAEFPAFKAAIERHIPDEAALAPWR